jgi:hypothetical protein
MPVFSRTLVFLSCLALGLAPFLEKEARAADDEVVVVHLEESAAAFDAEKLRAALAEELHATVVFPEDPRASGAKGTLTIEAAPAKHAMRITYAARTTPTVRTVVLPEGADAARREAVLVAGNLARDEGAELARELRKKQEPPPGPSAPAKPSRIAVRRVLEQYAAQDRAFRRAAVFGTLGVGVAGIGVGTAVYAGGDRPVGTSILVIGVAVTAYAGLGYALAPDSPFDTLLGRAALQSGELDELWAQAAADEHSERRYEAIFGFIGAGVMTGLGTWALIDDRTWGSDRKENGALLLAVGAGAGLASVMVAATDGPLERGLRVYERTIGQPVAPRAASTAPRFAVAPVPGGAIAALGGVF